MDEVSKSVVQSGYLWINLDEYNKIANVVHYNYSNSQKFDFDCGIQYVTSDIIKSNVSDINPVLNSLPFSIINEKRYLFAKLKYGI